MDFSQQIERTPPPDKPPHPWARRLGPLAPLAVLLAKAKTLLFALFKLKFFFSFAAFLGIRLGGGWQGEMRKIAAWLATE